jgi:hypothetical protein
MLARVSDSFPGIPVAFEQFVAPYASTPSLIGNEGQSAFGVEHFPASRSLSCHVLPTGLRAPPLLSRREP